MTIKERLVSIAYEEGFDIVKFSRVNVDPKDVRFYLNWLEEGKNGSMSYLSKNLDIRFDIRSLEKNFKSIMVLGVSYFNSSNFDRPSEEYGRVSMYAWGRDYHYVIKQMLASFYDRITREIHSHIEIKYFVDSSPIYEKGFAKGYLGFQGKNTNIINPKIGSFIFIAEILLDVEIEPDPHENFSGCGKCSLCIDTCPTGALEPYLLNANKCISYLTIEYKGVIPEDLAFKMRDWVFGCDDCQTVCPFNKISFIRKLKPKIRDFLEDLSPFLNLKDIMNITSENKFRKIFQGKAILRARRRGLVRNAIIVALNNKAFKLKDYIFRLTKDNDEVISTTASWALGKM